MLHATFDLVAYCTELFVAQRFWIGQRPILAMARWQPRARVTTTHRYDPIEGLIGKRAQWCGNLCGDVATTFGHEGNRAWIDGICGFRTRGMSLDATCTVHAREACRHLAAASVLDADEQHAWRVAHPQAPPAQQAFSDGVDAVDGPQHVVPDRSCVGAE